MNILQVVHNFLPRHQAGTELYTCHLAKELSKRHKVHLFFAESDPECPQYTVRNGVYQGLPYTEVINNDVYSNFEETYNNPEMDEIFRKVLDEKTLDIVHFQHLYNLSTNFVPIAMERNIPVVFTLL